MCALLCHTSTQTVPLAHHKIWVCIPVFGPVHVLIDTMHACMHACICLHVCMCSPCLRVYIFLTPRHRNLPTHRHRNLSHTQASQPFLHTGIATFLTHRHRIQVCLKIQEELRYSAWNDCAGSIHGEHIALTVLNNMRRHPCRWLNHQMLEALCPTRPLNQATRCILRWTCGGGAFTVHTCFPSAQTSSLGSHDLCIYVCI